MAKGIPLFLELLRYIVLISLCLKGTYVKLVFIVDAKLMPNRSDRTSISAINNSFKDKPTNLFKNPESTSTHNKYLSSEAVT